MDRAAAEAEAAKRERHKSKHMTRKRWQAVHTSTKGWHVALVDHHALIAAEAEERARLAFMRGDGEALVKAVGEALMARTLDELSRV